MYFRLNPYCHYIREKHNGCIYNLFTGEMWQIDPQYEQAILAGEIGNVTSFAEQLNTLVQKGIGLFYDKPVRVEFMDPGVPLANDKIMPQLIQIKKLYFVMTGRCSQKCSACSANMIRMTGCKYHKQSQDMDISAYKKVVKEAALLGCKKIRFTGGDPMLEIEMIKHLILFAEDYGYIEFDIITNGSLLDEQIVSFLNAHKISISLQIVEQQNETFKMIQFLNNNSVKFNVTLLITQSNYTTIDYLLDSIQTITNNIHYDFMFHQNEIFNDPRIIRIYNACRDFCKVTSDTYDKNKRRNTCLSSQIAIMPNGDATPCPMMDDVIYFNVKSQELVDGLNKSNYKEISQLSRSKIHGCENCSFRFGCFDCRAVEYAITKDILGNHYCVREANEK